MTLNLTTINVRGIKAYPVRNNLTKKLWHNEIDITISSETKVKEGISEKCRNSKISCGKSSEKCIYGEGIIAVYAPENCYENIDKGEFYLQLDSLYAKVRQMSTITILVGDFNGTIDSQIISKIKRKYSYDKLNDNGERLIKFHSQNIISIVNLFFKKSCSSDGIVFLESILHSHHTYKLNLLTAQLEKRMICENFNTDFKGFKCKNIKCIINPEYGSDITIYPSRGIQQDCPISPLLHNFNLEMVMRNTIRNSNMVFKNGVNIIGSKLPNLCFPDDTCLLVNSWNDLNLMVNKFISACQPIGMELNMNKCKILMSKELLIQYKKNKHIPLNFSEIIRKFLNISLRARKLLFVTRIRSRMYYAAQSWTTTQAERINLISVERCIIRRLKLIRENKWLMSTTGASTPAVTPGSYVPMEKILPQGVIPEFNMKKETWGEFKERIEIICEIHGIKEDNMRRNLLLTSLPSDVYRKLRNGLAPAKPMSVQYERVVEILDRMLEPVESLLINRLNAILLRQEEDETAGRFLERVKEKVSKCGLDNSVEAKEMMTILCFVNGVKESEYKKAAIQQHRMKANSTVEETFNAVASAELIMNSEKANRVMNVYQKKSYCYCYGGKNHIKLKCKFKKEKCKICNKVGHLAKMCRNKKNSKTIDNIEREQETEEESEDSESQIYVINEINSIKENAKITAKINEKEIKMLLDTGTCKSLISENVWSEIGKPKIVKKPNTLRTFSVRRDKNIRRINIINELKVDLNKLYFKEIYVIEDVKIKEELKRKFPELFSEGLGCCNVMKAKISIKEGSIPKRVSYRLSNLNLKEKIDEEIKRLTELGVWSKIESSDWISPMSVAIKTNGKVRICANFKPTINKVIENRMFQIPTSAEIFSKLVNCCLFSSIDMSDAFLQIKVDEESSKLLVISTPIGLRKYERLPFGLSSSPIIFQEMMSSLL
uniref:CCHC-type domain-containing protein n=1 Tax=Strongyloides venezuelensis TaxID=75913 RepID=A0A0K0EWS1_STRVS